MTQLPAGAPGDEVLAPGRPLPDMTVPFEAVCHPEIARLEADALAWVSRYASSATVDELEKTRAGRIVARTASPSAPRELLYAYGKMLAWGFWFDDEFIDNVQPGSAQELPAIASVLDILDRGEGTGAAGERMESAFADVVAGLRQVLPDPYFTRWAMEMRLWFASMCMQNTMRASGRPPGLATYKTVRLYSVCTFPCIVLIDASQEAKVSWADYQDPRITLLRMRAANVVAWQNDIFSYFAEQRHPGQFWNLPAVYAAQGRTTTAALDRARHEVQVELGAFVRSEASLGNDLTAGQRAHLISLKQWMTGCHDWSIEAARRYVGWDHRDTGDARNTAGLASP